MITRQNALLILCWLVVLPGVSLGSAQPAWYLELKETVSIKGGCVKLADLSTGPLPAGVGDVVILAGGQPGTVKAISRKMVLRKLVTRGLSSGVRFSGPDWSRIEFSGAESTLEELRPRIRALIQPLVPAGQPGAPNSWFELELPESSFAYNAEISLSCNRKKMLVPGRNNLPVKLHDGSNQRSFQVIVDFHVSGETATALIEIPIGTGLDQANFQWQWQDLSKVGHGVVVGRETLMSSSAAKNIKPGHILREADLKNTPVILAGDRVEMVLKRGSLEVVVKGVARQNGSLGQTIPVRNILNGRLVNATVSGPGLVQWRN